MKTSHDPRHKSRKHALKELFAVEFNNTSKVKSSIALDVLTSKDHIDQEISKAAPERPIIQINKIDLAILRLAVFELIIKKDVPFKVVVDEAIELAKEYGGDSSPAFINGVLGKVIDSHHISNSNERSK